MKTAHKAKTRFRTETSFALHSFDLVEISRIKPLTSRMAFMHFPESIGYIPLSGSGGTLQYTKPPKNAANLVVSIIAEAGLQIMHKILPFTSGFEMPLSHKSYRKYQAGVSPNVSYSLASKEFSMISAICRYASTNLSTFSCVSRTICPCAKL